MPEFYHTKTADTDGLQYASPHDDPYTIFGPVHTCLYVRVCEIGDWDLFLGLWNGRRWRLVELTEKLYIEEDPRGLVPHPWVFAPSSNDMLEMQS